MKAMELKQTHYNHLHITMLLRLKRGVNLPDQRCLIYVLYVIAFCIAYKICSMLHTKFFPVVNLFC
jgi:hypothetical protein